jgi:hypothetical protein
MAEKLDGGEVFTGPSGQLGDSPWLTSEDLLTDGGDITVQIEAVIFRRNVRLKNETKDKYGSLRFVGKSKELGLNATNRHILTALFGSNCAKWQKQWVKMYVDTQVKSFGGAIVSGIRIRPTRVKPPAAGADKSEAVAAEA